MEFNEVFSQIPKAIADLYQSIYVVDRKENEYYQVHYTGEKLSISVPSPLEELEKLIPIEELPFHSLLKVNGSTLYKEKKRQFLMTVQVIEDYSLLLLQKIEEPILEKGTKDTLLIADDSPIITNFFKKIAEEDYNVMVCKDGEEVLECLKNHSKEIKGIFLDLNMPVMSGYEVLEYFKDHHLFQRYPVSVITGEDSKDGIARVSEYEIVDVLQKPFSREAARTIISKTVQVRE